MELFFVGSMVIFTGPGCQGNGLSEWRKRNMRFTAGLKLGLAGFVSFLLPSSVSAAGMPELAVYRGVYDLQLENALEKSGITGLTGRMVYEFNGSKCEGYTTQFRLMTRVDTRNAPLRVTDQQVTSFESADGRDFHFASKNYIGQELTKEVVGIASRTGNAVKVRLTKPEEALYELKSAEFPIAHTVQVIRNALAGKRFSQLRLYDSSEDANELVETVVVIGKKKRPGPDRETALMGAYGNEAVWPVTVSYFNGNDNRESLPAYRTSFLLYRNGITRDLLMDYGDFSIRGKLVRLDILDRKADSSACVK